MSVFEGLSGWITAKAMERMNADAEREAVTRLAPAPGARILTIGFGPGVGLEHLLKLPVAAVVGVDPSAVMHRIAGTRNRDALAQGRLTLVQDVVEQLDSALAGFDGAIAVHTLQMCRPFAPTAERLSALMKPGSKIVSITHAWAAAKDYGSVECFAEAIGNGLTAAGFASVWRGKAVVEDGKAIVIEAIR